MERHKNAKIPCIGKDSGRTNSSKISAFDYWEGKIFEMDQVLLYEVILTANFLDINFLLTAGCVVVAEMIKGKSPETSDLLLISLMVLYQKKKRL